MKYLGKFKIGDTIRYSVNFHDDSNTTADPTSPIARMRKPDNSFQTITTPAKLDSKTGWYGGSIDTTGFDAGSYEIRISGTVDAHEVATVASFELEEKNNEDIWDLLSKNIGVSGKIVYVDPTNGNDSYDGLTPETAKGTIAAGTGIMTNGATMIIAPGSYSTEILSLGYSYCDVILKPGVTIYHASTDPLIISGQNNRIIADGVTIQAGASNRCVQITGNYNLIRGDLLLKNGATGIDFIGSYNRVYDVTAWDQSVGGKSFTFKRPDNMCVNCIAKQDTAGITGFHMENDDKTDSAHRTTLINCHTILCTTSSFTIDSLNTDCKIVNCSRGRACADKVDNGTNNSWHMFSETSQIATGETIEQDLRSIYDSNPKRIGTIYYVDFTNGNNSNDGLTPATAWETAVHAASQVSAGDMVIVTGVVDNAEMDIISSYIKWKFQTGFAVDHDPSPGPPLAYVLRFSGDYNEVEFESCEIATTRTDTALYGLSISGSHNIIKGDIRIDAPRPLLVGGNFNVVKKILGTSILSSYSCSVTGTDNIIEDVFIRFGSYGFYVAGDNNILRRCSTDESTMPIEVTADNNLFVDCSEGRGCSNSKVDSGSNNTFINYRKTSQLVINESLEDDISLLAKEANVEGHVTSSLNSYDPPTKTEMDAGFAALNDPSAADIASEVDTVLSASHGSGQWDSTADPAAIADAVWDEPHADHQDLTKMGGIMRILKAFSKYNIVYDNQQYSANGNLTSMRIRLFDTAAAAASATKGGSGEGEFATLTVSGTYDASNLLDLGKVVAS